MKQVIYFIKGIYSGWHKTDYKGYVSFRKEMLNGNKCVDKNNKNEVRKWLSTISKREIIKN